MKIILLLAVVGAALAHEVDVYTTANDNLDMQAVVNDPKKLQAMTDCFMDKGPCGPVAESYKLIVPDSIARACDRCNDAQKHLANTYIRGLYWNLPDEYINFMKKYDPQGIYEDNFRKAVKNY